LDRLEKQRLQWDLARALNQYAWLVCNTTGDYKKAVDYSVKSLEIRNWESASYLDTLGHAYFAAKDFENAVKYQQQAVDKDPGSLGMRRQLKVFQTALHQQRANQG
jgi:tetratricopeptide (TPR) repeat protein